MRQINNEITERPSLLIAAGLLALATLSRFYGISEWHIIGDEYFTVYEAHNRYKSFVNPSYYAIVVGIFETFGFYDWMARIPAFVMGVISVPVFYLTWSRVFGRKAALFGALILIMSAWHLWYSQYGRYYSAVFLFSILAYYYFYSAIMLDRIWHLVLALIMSIVGISFHATFIFVPASCGVFYLFILFHKQDKGQIFSKRVAKLYLSICALGVFAAIPFLMMVLNKWLSLKQTWGYGPLLVLPQVVKYVQLPIIITAVFGLFHILSNKLESGVFFAIGIGVPAFFLMLGSTSMSVSPSYVFYILPLVVLLSGYSCEIAWKALDKQSVMSYALISVVLICLIPEFASHYLAKKSSPLAEGVSVVELNYKTGDNILSFVNGFNLYTKSEFKLHPFISHERDNTIDWRANLNHLVTNKARTWVIVSSKRAPLARDLERWLTCHGTLVWRKFSKRLDYEVDGYEIFLINNKSKLPDDLIHCN